MDYARHHAELSSRSDDGVELRAYLEASAAKGNQKAMERLAGPEFPESLEYLWVWNLELYGRSGVGMSGLVPLTYTTLKHWSEMTEQYPTPAEVQALMALDSVMRSPDAAKKAEPEPESKPAKAWPEKKHG